MMMVELGHLMMVTCPNHQILKLNATMMIIPMENTVTIHMDHLTHPIHRDLLHSNEIQVKILQGKILVTTLNNRHHTHLLVRYMMDHHMGHHLDTPIIRHLQELVPPMDTIIHRRLLDKMAGIHPRHQVMKEDLLPIICIHHLHQGMGLHRIPCILHSICTHHLITIPTIHLHHMDIPIIMDTPLRGIVGMTRILRDHLEAMEVSFIIVFRSRCWKC